MNLRADLRSLIAGQEATDLSLQAVTGDNLLNVTNAINFSANDFILVGSLGTEGAEIQEISSISGNIITLVGTLNNNQPQDTTIVLLPFDEINFFHSTTLTSTLNLLAGPLTLTPENVFFSYNDTGNTTGYGWYQFYNSETATSSQLSNAVPYAGFADNSVKAMLDRFYVQITNREKKLIKDEDVIEWMKEAYSIARNRLNITNRAYNVPTPTTFNVTAGTAEYALPDQFSKVRTVNSLDGTQINFISLDNVPNYINTFVPVGGSLEVRYYLRNNVIGFAPTPQANTTYYLYYQTNSPVLASYIDYIDLPNNNYYCLLDYLLYRACPIVGGNAQAYLKAFTDGINNLIITSHKQDNDPQKFDVDWHTVV